MPEIFEIPLSKLSTINKRYKRLLRRHAQNGLPTPTLEVLREGVREVTVRDRLARLRGGEDDTRTVRAKTAVISIDGFRADIGDWSVVGHRWTVFDRRVDEVERKIVATGVIPADIAGRDQLCCDHCNALRDRHSSYVVQKTDGTGEAFEVGASCASVFLGYDFASSLDGLAQNNLLLKELHELSLLNPIQNPDDIIDEVDTVLAVAISRIRNEGFISAKQAGPDYPATWLGVYEDVRVYRNPELDDSDLMVTGSDFMDVRKVKEWSLTEEFGDADHPYVVRTRSILENGVQSPQDVAILTALVGSYEGREARMQARAKKELIQSQSSHVGLADERMNLVVTVTSLKRYETRFGTNEIVNMRDASHNFITWFSSSLKHGFQVGNRYEILGTIKTHDHITHGEFQGAKRTVLSRVKNIQDFGPDVDTPDPFTPVQEERSTEEKDFDALLGYLSPRM
jgi:hypothetical protein